jgi:hypothetical protein
MRQNNLLVIAGAHTSRQRTEATGVLKALSSFSQLPYFPNKCGRNVTLDCFIVREEHIVL